MHGGELAVLDGPASWYAWHLVRDRLATDRELRSRPAVVQMADALERAAGAYEARMVAAKQAREGTEEAPSRGRSVPCAPNEVEHVSVEEFSAMTGVGVRRARDIAKALGLRPPGRGRPWRIPRGVALEEQAKREEARGGP